MSAANDHSATPVCTLARWSSFTSDTKVPSRNTSTIPQGLTARIRRNIAGTPGGTRPRRSGTNR